MGGYERIAGRQDLLRRAGELAAKTIVIDVEPLIASWDTGQEPLDHGVALLIDQAAALPAVRVVCFATNSVRKPSAVPALAGLEVRYVASAGKPLRTAPYRDLPRPGVVIGDQVATDGILARRLGYTFLHYLPPRAAMPIGPRLLRFLGRPLRPLVFRRPGRPLLGSPRAPGSDADSLGPHDYSATAGQRRPRTSPATCPGRTRSRQRRNRRRGSTAGPAGPAPAAAAW